MKVDRLRRCRDVMFIALLLASAYGFVVYYTDHSFETTLPFLVIITVLLVLYGIFYLLANLSTRP